MIRRGAARRLGLRQPRYQIPLAYVDFPGGLRRKIVLGGSKLRPFYANDKGTAVTGPRVYIGAGMIGEHRAPAQWAGEA